MKTTGCFNSIIIRTEGLSEQEKELVCSVYQENGKTAMYEYFNTKKILPFAAKTFCNLGLDSDFWLPILEEYRERNRKIVAFLDVAYKTLREYGVKKAFLTENFSALLTSGRDIGLFASGDVDNCYDPEEKEKIYSALKSLGCTYRERYSLKRLNGTAWYLPPEYGLPKKFHVGFQPTPLSRLYLPNFVSMNDFDGWKDLYNYKDTSIQLPNPDTLLYICMLHISLHSFARAPDIRLYTDILNATQVEIDYKKIEDWAKKNNTKTRVSTAATLANYLMKTNIPDNIANLTDRKNKLINLVYDQSANDLIYEPQGLKVLKIESRCDDKGVIHGLFVIAFPEKGWMRQTYGGCGLGSYLKHIVRIL